MRKFSLIIGVVSLIIIAGCSKRNYVTNGERIYRQGQNLSGDKLLDKHASSIRFINSCQGCHGSKGKRLPYCTISWSKLSDPKRESNQYTDSLFFRFIDTDLKSNGSHVKSGVHWKMSDKDKEDLLAFLKTL